MDRITTKKGEVILIDKEDFVRVSERTWYVNKMGYVASDSGYRSTLHRFVLNQPNSGIDHMNGNKLDNRKSNLRLCNQSQNMANTPKRKTNTSGYKGVSYEKRNPNFKWVVNITKNYKHIYGGAFKTKEEAAKRYAELANKLFGEFARV